MLIFTELGSNIISFLKTDSYSALFFCLTASFIFGLCLGSFVQACIYRIPRGISIVFPPSACPNCFVHLKWHQNFPVFGWLAQKGRCRSCGVSIAFQYLAVELIFGLLSALYFWVFVVSDFNFLFYFQMMFLSCWLVGLAVIDFEHGILPDSLTLCPLSGFIVYDLFSSIENIQNETLFFLMLKIVFFIFMPWIFGNSFFKFIRLIFGEKTENYCLKIKKSKVKYRIILISSWILLVGVFFFFEVRLDAIPYSKIIGFLGGWFLLEFVARVGRYIAKTEAMGGGDVKLIACLGYLFGLPILLSILVVMCLSAGTYGGIEYLRKGKSELPLGPFIAVGTFFVYGINLLNA